MRDEVLLSMSLQNMDRSGYRASNLQVFEFQWENPQLEAEAVFRSGVDTTFPQQRLTA